MSALSESFGSVYKKRVARTVNRINTQWLLGKLVLHIILIVTAALFLLPLAWLVISSLKLNAEFTAYPPQFFPKVARWENYAEAIDKLQFIRAAWNTLVLAALYSVLNVISSAFTGFGFARYQVPGRNVLFTLLLATMMVPAVVMIIPQFVLYSRIGLVGSVLPWVLWGLAGNPFQIFLFRQFFAGFPRDLEDAAEVDGCSPPRMFFQIFLPNAGPVIAATTIFSFQWVWGDFFFQSLFLGSGYTTLAIELATAFISPRGLPDYTLTLAGIVMYTLPLIVVYFIAQRYIIRGIVTTGLK
jgi:multiple sugar transport system permease protein